MYDIFFVTKDETHPEFFKLKTRFPFIKKISSFDEAKLQALTEFYWVVWDDLLVEENFEFDYVPDEWSKKYVHVFLNFETYDGISLVPTNAEISKKEILHRFYVNHKKVEIIASYPQPFDVFEIDSYEEYQYALTHSKTEMFWMVSKNLKYDKNFIEKFYIPVNNIYDRNENHAFVHLVAGQRLYNGVFLLNKKKILSKREIEYRFPVERKEWEEVVSEPTRYDIFEINTYEDYLYAMEHSKTEMFWATHPSIKFLNDFEFLYFSHDNEYDRSENHAFKHRNKEKETYSGVFLFSKKRPVSKREIVYRFLVNAKQWDIVASEPKPYDVFYVDTYEDYLTALENSKTEMFWVIPSHVQLVDTFNFDYHVDLNDEYLRTISHVFLNGSSYDGVVLSSKHRPITEYEFNRNFIANKVEINVLASNPKEYEVFVTSSYEDYLEAKEKTKYRYFWIVPQHVELLSNFEKSPKFLEKHDERSRNITHVFLNGENYNGVMLCSKNTVISKREYDYNYVIDRIEVPVQASVDKRYDVFFTKSYEDYTEAVNNTKTKYFWIVPDHVELLPDFDFNVKLNLNDEHSRNVTHVFMNGKFNDGPMICSKTVPISKKEYDFNYVANRIDHPQVISSPKPFDIVFISYQEPNAEENYKNLLDRFPRAKRIHGVKGIHQAHIEAAKVCTTDMFWIVDGDAIIVDDFNFNYQVPKWEFDTVHVWRSINPINHLTYGYGGIKLFPREMALNMDTSKTDMTTSISKKFKAVNEVSNITAFNTDPFNTWKSAFRECAKLASKTIDRQKDEETDARLNVWCTAGNEKQFGDFSIAGANMGRQFGIDHKDDLSKINDFKWLREIFNDTYK